MIKVSPTGDLYTILVNYDSETEKETYSLSKLNHETREWGSVDTDHEVIDAKFTGDVMVTQDNSGNIFDHQGKFFSTLSKIYDYGVAPSGHLHLIFDSELVTEEDKNGGLEAELAGKGLQATVYYSDVNTGVWMNGEEAILIDAEGNLVGYGGVCISDLSVGTDGSLWAFNCEPNPESEYEEF